ncbi:homeobox KN domain-containing protein [Obelidium mucronatum]|nr:homeobox KN domain-containing protein [Obelidium mucronatum]
MDAAAAAAAEGGGGAKAAPKTRARPPPKKRLRRDKNSDDDDDDGDARPRTAKQQKTKSRPNHKPNITARLFKWLMEHQHEPYPSEEEKKDMAGDTGLTMNQINDWFINARRRYLK